MSLNSTYEVAAYTTTITEEDIEEFAELTGDHNPLHTDDKFAQENTQFGGKIAHGALVASTISSALARLDGVIIYVDQELNFRESVKPGTEVTSFVRLENQPERKFETFDTEVIDEYENVVIEGEATILRQ